MQPVTLGEFARIIEGQLGNETLVSHSFSNVTVDSRKISQNALFFALKGNRLDGHSFVSEAIKNGAIAAVISRENLGKFNLDIDKIVIASEPLEALQKFATWWRKQISGQVIAVTGSNGKTIVKDALIKILSYRHSCSGTPDSFNSLIGVPLSVVRVLPTVDYAVFEAGVSAPNESSALERIISPDYGIITNIGLAHLSSFGDRETIAFEKAKLFSNLPSEGWLLIPHAEPLLDQLATSQKFKVYRFGKPSDELPYIESKKNDKTKTLLNIRYPAYGNLEIIIASPSAEIAIDLEIAICASYLLGVDTESIVHALSDYAPSPTRMEIWKSPEGLTFINDAYSSDPLSVKSALRSLEIFKGAGKKIFVFGGMKELGNMEEAEHAQIGILAAYSQVDAMVLIGDKQLLSTTEKSFKVIAPDKPVFWCTNSTEVKRHILPLLKFGDVVLFKGPRNAGIDQAMLEMVDAISPNRFMVDLQAIKENVLRFKQLIGSSTRILAMVKALAYGSDSIRLSLELQQMGVDYLGVANADEGSALRRAGVDLPILVMMSTPEEAPKFVHYQLTPVIYTSELVESLSFAAAQQKKPMDVHIKVDTGMGRLGVMPNQVTELVEKISKQDHLRLAGIMTHFASAEDPTKDAYTYQQIKKFNAAVASIEKLGYKNLIRHASATAGTVRFPEARYDMVRIGLGMYGIYPSQAVNQALSLELAVALTCRIVNIKVFPQGSQIGYGGTFTVPHDHFRVGFVPLGYHDGVPLSLSNRGRVMVNGQYAPIIGRISMDSLLIDLCHLPDIEVNADVLVYGKYKGNTIRPEDVALDSGSTSWELLSRLSSRVQRIFVKKPN